MHFTRKDVLRRSALPLKTRQHSWHRAAKPRGPHRCPPHRFLHGFCRHSSAIPVAGTSWPAGDSSWEGEMQNYSPVLNAIFSQRSQRCGEDEVTDRMRGSQDLLWVGAADSKSVRSVTALQLDFPALCYGLDVFGRRNMKLDS